MSSIDKRIVEMEFDNAKFESGVKTTIGSLDKLKESLDFSKVAGAAKEGLSDLNSVSLSAIQSGVEALQNRFSTFGIIGMQVVERLTDAAINLALKLKEISLDKVFEGGKNRAMKIEQARFMLQGLLSDTNEVEEVLKNAKDSVDGTAYALDSAANAAAQFAASGLQSGEQMEGALRAIAGTAAMTGSEYEDISRIFTTVAGNGRLMGDQLLQMSSRGLNAASTLRDFINGVNDGSIEVADNIKNAVSKISTSTSLTESDIRDFVSKGKVSFEVFSSAMDTTFGEHAKKANETFTGALANIGSALARIGANFYEPIVKQNSSAVKMFNSLRQKINEFNVAMAPVMRTIAFRVLDVADAISTLIDNSKGFDFTQEAVRIVNKLFSTLKETLSGLSEIGKSIKEAFQNIFPQVTIDGLESAAGTIEKMAEAFNNFMKTDSVGQDITSIFSGFFAVIDSGIEIIRSFIRVFNPFGEGLETASKGVLGFAGSIGEWFVEVNKYIKDNEVFDKFFKTIKDGIESISTFISDAWKDASPIIDKIGEKLSDFKKSFEEWLESFGGFKKVFDDFKKALSDLYDNLIEHPLKTIGDLFKGIADGIVVVFNGLKSGLETVLPFLKPLFDGLSTAIGDFFTFIKNTLDEEGLKGILSIINSIIAGKAIEGFDKFTAKVSRLIDTFDKGFDTKKLGKSMLDLTPVINELSNTLQTVQQSINAGIIIKIAGAVFILAKAIETMAEIDTSDLGLSVAAVGALLAEMVTAMEIISEITSIKSFGAKNPLVSFFEMFKNGQAATAILKVTAGVVLLSKAVVQLGQLDPEQLGRGVAAISAMLAELLLFVNKMPKDLAVKSSMFIVLGAAVNEFAIAIKSMADLEWEQLAVGLTGMLGGLLIVVAALNNLSNPKVLAGAGAIAIVCPALNLLATTLLIMSKIDPNGMVVALGGLAIGVSTIAVALINLSSPKVLSGAAAIAIVAPSLNLLATTLLLLSQIKPDTLGVSLAGLAGGIATIVVALSNLSSPKVLSGAAAIAIVCPSLNLLATTLLILSTISGESMIVALAGISVGLASIAITLINLSSPKVLSGAAAIAIICPSLILLATAMRILGQLKIEQVVIGMAALAGVLAIFGTAATLLAPVSGIILQLSVSLTAFAASVALFGLGIAALGVGLSVIAASGAAAGAAIVTMIASIIAVIPILINNFGTISEALLLAAGNIIGGFLDMLDRIIPSFIKLGSDTLLALLDGIVAVLPNIRERLVSIIGEVLLFIDDIAVDIIDEGIKIVQWFLEGLNKRIDDITDTAIDIVLKFLGAVADRMDDIAAMGLELLASFIDGMATAIDEKNGDLIDAIDHLMTSLVQAIAEWLTHFVEKGADIVESLLTGVLDFVGNLFKEFGNIIAEILRIIGVPDEFIEMGGNLINGFIDGIIGGIKAIVEIAHDIFTSFINAIKDFFGIHSPSTVMEEVGGFIMEGLLNGITGFVGLIVDAVTGLVGMITDAFSGLMETSASVGEAIYDALHADDVTGSWEDEYYSVAKKALQSGSDGSEFSGRMALYYRKLANVQKAYDNGESVSLEAGYSQAEVDYYNELVALAGQKGTEAGSAYAGNSCAEIEYSKSQQKKAADEAYSDTDKSAGDAGKESGDKYAGNSCAQIEYSKSQHRAATKTAYSETGEEAGAAGTNDANKYAGNSCAQIEYSKSLHKTSTQAYYSAGAEVATAAGTSDATSYVNNESSFLQQATAQAQQRSSVEALFDAAKDVPDERGILAGTGFGSKLAEGMDSKAPSVNSSGASLGAEAAAGVETNQSKMAQAGRYLADGLATGLSNGVVAIKEAAANVALQTVEKFKEKFKINSPSKVMIPIGEWIVEGMIVGIDELSEDLYGVSGDVAEGTISTMVDSLATNALPDAIQDIDDQSYVVMNDAIKRISDLANGTIDVTPTISPVLDLSNVEAGISRLNDIFNTGRTIALSDGAFGGRLANDNSTMLESMDRNEKRIVEAITQIRGDINGLQKSIASMQLVMDSGALVGEIAPSIDYALGSIAQMKRRGGA